MSDRADASLGETALAEAIIPAISAWYEGFRRTSDGSIDANVMCAGLYITDYLGQVFPLEESDYLTRTQVKGAGGPRVKGILLAHGEVRPFLSEGGRTSRATVPLARQLAEILNGHDAASALEALDDTERKVLAFQLQAWFVDKVRVDYFGRQRISAEVNPTKSARFAISSILQAARGRHGNVAGAVAQHLVGAKLSLRFPDLEVNNENYTTADQQTDRPGDFLIGDTAFHVTMSPGQPLFENRCRANLNHSYRPRVLVPEDKLDAARQLAELADLGDGVATQSIEDFVGTNVEEMAIFTATGIKSGLRALLERYNERVQAVEPDPSLLIDIPANL